jgi:hypothetical protein
MRASLLAASIVVLASCQARGSDDRPMAPPAPPDLDGPVVSPGTRTVTTVRARVRPKAGRFEILDPGAAARGHYDFSGGATGWSGCAPPGMCLPDKGEVALYTDQTKVTYWAYDDTCWSNGKQIDCHEIPVGPCRQRGAFCAPVALYSNVTFGQPVGALADVVVQLAQKNSLQNSVTGCLADGPGDFGHCRGEKVDHPNSNLVSPIPGNGAGTPATIGCSYCYGNKNKAIALGFPGLEHAVVSGLADFLAEIDTDTFALHLANDLDHEVEITVRAAVPTLAPPGQQVQLFDGPTPVACAKPGVTTLVLAGGGFGPPGDCLKTSPPSSCPVSGPPAPGFQLFVPTADGLEMPAGTTWSDTEIRALLPADLVSGPVMMLAPHGSPVQSADVVRLCLDVVVGPLIVSGAGRVSGGAITGTVEVGHGARRGKAASGSVSMEMVTAVKP